MNKIVELLTFPQGSCIIIPYCIIGDTIMSVKVRRARVICLCLSLAEMISGIFSESLSFAALGAFLALFACGFFEKKKKSVLSTVVSVLFFIYIAVLSVFETFTEVGYYESAPAFWIFPVIAVLFFVREALEKNYGSGENGGVFFSKISAVFYGVTLVCIVLSLFVEYYFEPIWATALSLGGIYMILKNLNWSKR